MFNPDPVKAGFSPERLRRVSALLQDYIQRGDVTGISATIARKGTTAYSGTFGWLDREADIPMRDDAVFMIQSLSKPVTAVAAMTLYEEGKFDLNTPIAKYLPAFRDTKVFVREVDGHMEVEDLATDITFRHVFTHTAGLSYGWFETAVDREYRARLVNSTTPMSNRFLAETLPSLPLMRQPGTRWQYSIGIDLLGALIEVISGQSLDAFFDERVFGPLDMVDTAFHLPEAKRHRRAVVYGQNAPGDAYRRLDHLQPSATPPLNLGGGGGLVSTLKDYARFAAMLVNGGALDGVRVLSPSTVALFTRNLMPPGLTVQGIDPVRHLGYGFSLGTRVLVDVAASGGAGNAGEFGWDGAFNTYFWVDPVESMYGVLMLQRYPYASVNIAREFRQLTYQALVG